jgi:competence protein ComEC
MKLDLKVNLKSSRLLWFLPVVALLTGCPKQNTTENPPASSGGTVMVRFLDVGQGDAILITSPEGKNLIYDGGRSADRLKKQLEQNNIQNIEIVVASHADADHIAGLKATAVFKPKFFINNGIPAATATYEKLIDAFAAAGTKAVTAKNQNIMLGSLKIQIIPPPSGMPQDEQNINSVGLELVWGGQKVLMTGDSETPETKAWLEQRRGDFSDITFYKSIHHGAKNGDNRAWLDVVKPKNVFIGVGPNNYGHPTSEALELYKQAGATVYRTDLNGTITLTLESNGTSKIETERQARGVAKKRK